MSFAWTSLTAGFFEEMIEMVKTPDVLAAAHLQRAFDAVEDLVTNKTYSAEERQQLIELLVEEFILSEKLSE